MDTSKITNVLIFKDGYYYLTILSPQVSYEEITNNIIMKPMSEVYEIVPKEWEINNGFEFASDAYAYLARLQNTSVGALATVGVGGNVGKKD